MKSAKKSAGGALLITLFAASMIWAFGPKSSLFQQPEFGIPKPGGFLGFLNNNNFSVKNQFFSSFTSFNGSSFLQNLYVSSFTYKISASWNLTFDLGATKFSGLSGPSRGNLTSPVIPLYGFRAEYKKTKDSRLVVNFGNFQQADPFRSSSFFSPFPSASSFRVPSGSDILKYSDWSLYFEKSFFNDLLNVSIYYGHTAPPR